MTQNSAARGCAYWHDRLRQTPLPTLLLGRPGVLSPLLGANTSLQQVQHVLEGDPVAAVYVLNAANRVNRNQETDIHNLRHAVAVLGMDKLQQVLRGLARTSVDMRQPGHRAFIQALSISVHAAEQARDWEDQRAPGTGENAYWNTLVYGVADWSLPLASPEAALMIEKLIQLGYTRTSAQERVLGCRLAEVAAMLLQHWQLTEYTQACIQPLLQPDPRMLARLARCAWHQGTAPEVSNTLARVLHQPYFSSLLANLLAWSSHRSWYSKSTQAYLGILSAYLNQPFDTVCARAHRIAALASRDFPMGDIWLPAEQLFWPPLPLRGRTQHPKRKSTPQKPTQASRTQQPAPVAPASEPASQPKAAPTQTRAVPAKDPQPVTSSSVSAPHAHTAETQPSPQQTSESKKLKAKPKVDAQTLAERLALLEARKTQKASATPAVLPSVKPSYIKALQNSIEDGECANLHQLMHKASETLDKALGLPRCLLLMKSAQDQALHCYFAHGFHTQADVLKSLKLPLQDESALLTRLFNSGAALWVHADNQAKLMPAMPPSLQSHLDANAGMLATLKVNTRHLGILYADAQGQGAASEDHYKAFRLIAQSLNAGLLYLTQKR